MKLFFTFLLALSFSGLSQEVTLKDILEKAAQAPEALEAPEAVVIPLTIEEVLGNCREMMEIKDGGNGPQGEIAKFSIANLSVCLESTYREFNSGVSEELLGSLLLNTYMEIFRLKTNVYVSARAEQRNVEYKVATHFELIPGTKVILTERPDAYFGHGTTSELPLANILGFIIEL